MSEGATGSEAAGPRLRVVVADDDRDMRMLVRLVLEGAGRVTVVGEAADGAEAVELARDLHPGGVVLDLNMPILDGRQAADAILSDTPETAVVIFTSTPPEDAPHPTVMKASEQWAERLTEVLLQSGARAEVDWPAWERRQSERPAG